MEAFARQFKPTHQLLVGGQGIAVEEFLSKPAAHWLNCDVSEGDIFAGINHLTKYYLYNTRIYKSRIRLIMENFDIDIINIS